jgi:phosphocarrier protein
MTLLAILAGTLAAGIGSTVTLETVGEKEDEAMQALTALINDRFGEGE